MDKYRIHYKCFKQPKPNSELAGFDVEKIYTGRAFNGLFEVTPDWGSGQQTKIIEKSIFNQYFEMLRDR
ncbi:MAG: hypothetical protein ACNS62_00740 [Candidatus Cyclobacteriaceae bacterium M3_2C_046]